MKTVLSFGAGVQTTAMLFLIGQRILPRPDAILFADTGQEKPETYDYLAQYIAPYALEHGLEVIVLGPEYRTKHYAADLLTYCMEHRMLPGTWVRWCTDRYKVKPLAKWRKQYMGASKDNPIESWIGISIDEKRRATPSNRPEEIKRYPLIELGLSRIDCQQIILDAGYPVPPKSGCWFCPFQKKSAWQTMKRNQPDKFAAALTLERNARHKDGSGAYLPMFGSLASVAAQDELPGFDEAIEAEGECVTGSCFV